MYQSPTLHQQNTQSAIVNSSGKSKLIILDEDTQMSKDITTYSGNKAIQAATSFDSLVQAWLSYLKAENYKETTLTTYKRSLSVYVKFCTEIYPKLDKGIIAQLNPINPYPYPLNPIDPQSIEVFRQWGKANGSLSTVNTRLSGLRTFLKYCFINGLLEVDLSPYASRFKQAKSKNNKRENLDNDEMKALLKSFDDTPKGLRDGLLINLMAYTALRSVECQRLQWGDIKKVSYSEGKKLLNRVVVWVHGKGRNDKDEMVILNPKLVKMLAEWRDVSPSNSDEDFVFCGISNRNMGKQLSMISIRVIVKSCFRRVGIDSLTKTTHSLRHTAITQAVLSGGSIEDVQSMARHSNVQTTMNYFHNTRRLKNAVELGIEY